LRSAAAAADEESATPSQVHGGERSQEHGTVPEASDWTAHASNNGCEQIQDRDHQSEQTPGK
jgi:hypothetical protein